MLSVGSQAPVFLAPADDGLFSLESLRGKHVILYFYPRDATPGCTTEAQNFRDLMADFVAANAVVVGVSKDTVKKHQSFKAKECLPFSLVSDTSDICEKYGIWREKTLYGKKSMGIVRATFWIDPEGKIRRIWDPVKVAGHAAEVLAAVRG